MSRFGGGAPANAALAALRQSSNTKGKEQNSIANNAQFNSSLAQGTVGSSQVVVNAPTISNTNNSNNNQQSAAAAVAQQQAAAVVAAANNAANAPVFDSVYTQRHFFSENGLPSRDGRPMVPLPNTRTEHHFARVQGAAKYFMQTATTWKTAYPDDDSRKSVNAALLMGDAGKNSNRSQQQKAAAAASANNSGGVEFESGGAMIPTSRFPAELSAFGQPLKRHKIKLTVSHVENRLINRNRAAAVAAASRIRQRDTAGGKSGEDGEGGKGGGDKDGPNKPKNGADGKGGDNDGLDDNEEDDDEDDSDEYSDGDNTNDDDEDYGGGGGGDDELAF